MTDIAQCESEPYLRPDFLGASERPLGTRFQGDLILRPRSNFTCDEPYSNEKEQKILLISI